MAKLIINKGNTEIDRNSILDNPNKYLIRWYNDSDHYEKEQRSTMKEISRNRKTDDKSVVGLSAFIASPKKRIYKTECDIPNRQLDSGRRKQINATNILKLKDSSSTLCPNRVNEVANLDFQDSTDPDNFIRNYTKTFVYSRTRLARVDERKLMASVLAIHENKNDNEILSEVNSIISSKRFSDQKNIGKIRKIMTKAKISSKKPQAIERVTATRNFVYEIGPIGTEIKPKEKSVLQISNQFGRDIKKRERNDDKELKNIMSSSKNAMIQNREDCSRDIKISSASLPKLLPKNALNVAKLQKNIDTLKQMITFPTIDSLDYKMDCQGKNDMVLYTRSVKNNLLAHRVTDNIKDVKSTCKLINTEVSTQKKDAANETISKPIRGNVPCRMTNYKFAQNRKDLLGNTNFNSIEMQIPKHLLLKILKSEYLRKDLPIKKDYNHYLCDSYSMY